MGRLPTAESLQALGARGVTRADLLPPWRLRGVGGQKRPVLPPTPAPGCRPAPVLFHAVVNVPKFSGDAAMARTPPAWIGGSRACTHTLTN